MKYDDASWHSEGRFPADLPASAAATHIGMFLAWAAHRGLIGVLHTEDFPDLLAQLLDHSLTPGRWLTLACDGKLTDEDLNDEGNAFGLEYYSDGESMLTYILDYSDTFPEVESLYSVPDTWESYAAIEVVIDHQYREWKRSQSPAN